MAVINCLPTELLIVILEELLEQLSKDTYKPTHVFSQSIRCCKRWYLTGMPILFSTIILQYPQLSRRLPLGFGPDHLLLAKSLIVQATADDFKSHRELHRRLRGPQLDNVLPLRVANYLTSFSLVYTTCQIPENWHHSLSIGSVKTLLECLPSSVINLDLDIPGVGVMIDPHSHPGRRTYVTTVYKDCNHLCSTLSSMLKRLKSLRVRASMICEGLFNSLIYDATCRSHRPVNFQEQSRPPLQTIILRLDPWNSAHATRHCKDDSKRSVMKWSDSPPLTLRDMLVSSLLHLLDLGALPYLQTCKIVSFASATTQSSLRLQDYFQVLQQAPSKKRVSHIFPGVSTEQYLEVMDVVRDKVTVALHLDHARITSDFASCKRKWETEAIDWESREEVERTWSWI